MPRKKMTQYERAKNLIRNYPTEFEILPDFRVACRVCAVALKIDKSSKISQHRRTLKHSKLNRKIHKYTNGLEKHSFIIKPEKQKNLKIAFIGARLMGSSFAKIFIKKGLVSKKNISLTNLNESVRNSLNKDFTHSLVTKDNVEAINGKKYIFLCVKPHAYKKALLSIKKHINPTQRLISILAGVKIKSIEKIIPGIPVIRLMPNIAVQVGEMACGYAFGKEKLDETEKLEVKSMFESIGMAFELKEKLINTVTGVSGSSPAFAFMFIESLADGGLLYGLPKSIGIQLAAKALIGAGKMVLESNKDLGSLRDSVSSPGGTTIKAIQSLEEDGFRSSIINAVEAVVEKAEELAESESDSEENSNSNDSNEEGENKTKN